MNPGPPNDNHEDDPERRNSNLVALAAVVVLSRLPQLDQQIAGVIRSSR